MDRPPGLNAEENSSSEDESTESCPGAPLSEANPQPGLLLASRSTASRLDPFEVRFSQMKMRHLFGDGRRVADSALEVKAVRCTEAEQREHGVPWRLVAPFPKIEVIRWHCKLRDAATGRPLEDPETGEDVISEEENWFTLDNRRLYCLQEAASRVWPERCVADVCVIISGPSSRMRELRKFRTLDLGKSALIGSRSDGVPFVRWSWRVKVGTQEPGESLEADQAIDLEVVRPAGGNILEHLATLKPDDFQRIEISKKLSWVLRRNGQGGRDHAFDLDFDEEGWLKVVDVTKVPFLEGISIQRLLQVVEDSNKQKLRYQLKQTPEGPVIRASGKKGVVDEAEVLTPQMVKDLQPIGAAPVPRGRLLGKNGLPRVEGRTAALETPMKEKQEVGRVPARPVAVGAQVTPAAPPPKKDKSLEELLAEAKIGYAGSPKASTPAAPAPQKPGKKPAGVPSMPPGGFAAPGAFNGPQGLNPAVWQQLMAQADLQPQVRAAMAGMAPKGSRPPGVHTAAAVPQVQFAQQMQAMRQMFQVSARYQMQVRTQLQALMQRRMLQQMQALQAANAMHAANEMQQMQQMQAMQAMYSHMQEEWAEQEEGQEGWDETEYDQDGYAPEEELEADLDSRIRQVLEAASQRSGAVAQQEEQEVKLRQLQSMSRERERQSQVMKDPQKKDIQAKIAEALASASKRNGATSQTTPPAKPSRTPAPPNEIEAKIAEAVSAAKERSGAGPADIQAKIASALSAAKERSGVAEVASQTPSGASKAQPAARPNAPTNSTDLQAKFAQALEAARSRNGAAKGMV